jgi:hypothetical protein
MVQNNSIWPAIATAFQASHLERRSQGLMTEIDASGALN